MDLPSTRRSYGDWTIELRPLRSLGEWVCNVVVFRGELNPEKAVFLGTCARGTSVADTMERAEEFARAWLDEHGETQGRDAW